MRMRCEVAREERSDCACGRAVYALAIRSRIARLMRGTMTGSMSSRHRVQKSRKNCESNPDSPELPDIGMATTLSGEARKQHKKKTKKPTTNKQKTKTNCIS